MATESSGSNPDFKTRIPGLVDDADIREALKVFLYGEPTVANSAAATGELTATDGTHGLVGHLNTMRTSLTNASVLKSLYSGSPTKGIILVSTDNNTPQAVSVGADATVLTADSSVGVGVAWKNPTDNLLPKTAGGSHPLTGSLNVAYANPKVIVNDTSSTGTALAEFQDASTKKWEVGKDASNNLVINNSSGTTVLTVTEATNKVSVSEQPASANDVATKTYVDTYGVPVGTVVTFAGSSAPTNWVLCYGQELAIATYGALYAVLSTTYGALTNGSGGAGSTHFRVPDLRGRTTAGVDNMGGSDAGRLDWANTLGTASGAQTHTLTSGESGLPAHNHTQNAHTHTQDSHNHTQNPHQHDVKTVTGDYYVGYWGAYEGYNTESMKRNSPQDYLYAKPTTATNNATTATNQNTTATNNNNTAANASSAHNNMQPTMLLNYIIKT